ncbi:MAG TPA: dihydrolipoyl dehydrogenase [Spirochaetia bacterium]|nr:dihydrolipoyl dehydrogenase [Spirochaetia bacterium]
MGSDERYDLVVLGSGPGGYVAAIRASQLGMKTAVVEADKVGGVCLNVGCIPSKSLIYQAGIYQHVGALKEMGLKIDLSGFDYGSVQKKSRKAAEKLSKGVQFLLKKNNVDLIEGYGRLEGPNEVRLEAGDRLSAAHIILATGSRTAEIPGFSIDEKLVLSSTGALMLQELPKSLLILGAGAIGVEFAYIMNAFGVEVHLVEMMDQILPLEDSEVVDVVARIFKKRGVRILTGTKALSWEKKGKAARVVLEDKSKKKTELDAEKILLAVGRVPNTEDIGLDRVGLETERGFIPVGDYYETAVKSICAIGDVVATPLLAHVASKEGEIAVEHMAGLHPVPRIDPLSIPGAVYTEPQLASFGYTEARAREKKIDFKATTFPYRGAGKSVAIEQPDGMVKILTDSSSGEILGAHVVGSEATELIHELLLARSSELLAEDVAGMIHAHPTLSEAVMEGMRSVLGQAIHV